MYEEIKLIILQHEAYQQTFEHEHQYVRNI